MKNCEKNMDFSMFWKMFSSAVSPFLFCCKYKISLLMPKSLWYNVNEKTNFVFTAAEGNFLKKMGFSTVIMNLHQKKKMEKRYDLSENIRQKLSKFRQTSPLLYAY